MQVAIERVVQHPPDRVFAVISDPHKRPLWQGNTSDVEVFTPGPSAVGTRWREQTQGVGTVNAEVVALEPDSLWQEAGTADAGEVLLSMRLRPDGAGATRVSVDVEIHLRGARRMFESALAPMVSRQVAANLAQLEALLEQRGEQLQQSQ